MPLATAKVRVVLSAGTRLGPYEIIAAVGAGGMGEVYRATDTSLKRQVAIKVLPQAVAADPERLARFQREAEVLAALNHPNIAHIHGLEKSDGILALVMELVEGPTLADRLTHSAIPVEEALPIARQIAAGLEAAHEKGIIHRDLKPANIKLRPDSIFAGGQDQNGVYVGSLDGKTKKFLVRADTNGVYAPPGFLLFVDGDTLLGQAFDAARHELKGQPFLVAEQVGKDTAFMSAVSASHTGTIAYAGTLMQSGRLVWIDRQGNMLRSTATPDGDYADFRLSPDEKRLAASRADPKTNTVGVWLTDLERGSSFLVAPGGLVTASALWSPDGTQLVFRTNRNGVVEFFQRSAAGGGDDRRVLSLEDYRTVSLSQNLIPTDWSRDGHIVFSTPVPASGSDLWLLPLEKEGKPVKLISSSADKLHGNFSPEDHLVAYSSNETGKYEVYVETVPQSDRKWPVSTDGGYEPRWRADGREIYYLAGDRKLMAVSVGAGPSFGIPKPLFQTGVAAGVSANRTHYVASRDGQRFLVNVASNTVASPITVVLNWTATLKK